MDKTTKQLIAACLISITVGCIGVAATPPEQQFLQDTNQSVER
jgi:hypothetical protein